MQALPEQAAAACATLVEQAVVHAPQWLALVVRSTQVPAQSVVDAGQPEAQAYVLPDAAQTGAPPSGAHDAVQLPQWAGWVMFVSQPSSGSPLQSAQPGAHDAAGNAHRPKGHVVIPLTWARFVQSFAHDPQ